MAKMAIRGWKQMSARPHSPATPHRRRPAPIETSAVSATHAKNQFGRILERVIQGGRVVITKHDSPKAVVISMEEFRALSNAPRVEIETLTDEFDRLLARMQTPAARAGMKAAFHATPNELGRAALAAARKRA